MVDRDAVVGGAQARPEPRLDALTETELGRWEIACRAAQTAARRQWPEPEARRLIEAVFQALFSGDESELRPAAEAWANATASMPVIVSRLGVLRNLLAAQGTLSPEQETRLAVSLDKVLAAATEASLSELEGAALTDPLTQAGNRRALEIAAKAALASSARTKQPLSVVVIDLDGLKTINDTAGHPAGDRALAGLSETLRGSLRETDQLFRIGGDEFVALLPLAPASAVPQLMLRARELRAPRFSFGAACAPADGTDLRTLLQVADSRLYARRRSAGYRPRNSAPSAVGHPRYRHHWGRAAVVAALAVGAVLLFALLSGGLRNGDTLLPNKTVGGAQTTAGGTPTPSGGTLPASSRSGTTGPGGTGTDTGSGSRASSDSGSGRRAGTSNVGSGQGSQSGSGGSSNVASSNSSGTSSNDGAVPTATVPTVPTTTVTSEGATTTTTSPTVTNPLTHLLSGLVG